MKRNLFGFALILTTLLAAPSQAQDLNIGDKAPSIDIEHWVSDGEGKFEHINEFEEGKVYIVEFWATWCGPCISAMPHISELQKSYAKDGLQIISVSDEDLETVEGFLEREVRGDDELTYGELTSTYCLTADPDESVHDDYMKAANQNGIPTAFIVGKTGEIEWIGHPMEIDEPIAQVLDGSWDREAYLKKMEEQKKASAILRDIVKRINSLMQEGELDEALEFIDSELQSADNEMVKGFLRQAKLGVAMEAGGSAAAKALKAFTIENKDDPMRLNEIAWGVVERQMASEEVSEEVINAATEMAKVAVSGAKQDAAILDTYAHLLDMQGNLDEAIKVQTEAVKFDKGNTPEIEAYLDELKEKKDK